MDDRLIWMDLEMTGLDPEVQVIVEIATVVTDGDLNIVAKGPALAIYHPPERLEAMEEWSRSHHIASGLMDRILVSKDDTVLAEHKTLEFLKQHCEPGKHPLCGNSVWQDRRFLVKYMPELHGFLSHRDVDVSSLKELVLRWYPQMEPFHKRKAHTALSDIMESINELKYYRDTVFVRPPA
ncbi:MAG: oligoribonuclease [Deltaproteobacteria bacterium]|nr:oligoribonuclease [Deltaproteobacteria bacterium]